MKLSINIGRSVFGVLMGAFAAIFTASAVEPAGYYSTCENKGGKNLLQALNTKVGPHTVVSYDGLWTLYEKSDVYDNGMLWDIYSSKQWTPGKEKCGNYKNVGDCINREHSFPKSWFNDAKPMYSDAFHLYPTDGKVNGQRSNFPYGECSGGTTLPSNNGVKALGRLGTSTFAGYSGRVFEPDDEYKGDLARSYFYMAAAYNDKIAGWNSDMLAQNAYPVFSDWALNVLLKWHRQDPVSQKEIDRNEAIYDAQNNRNPFIDHPEMVEYIWGNKKTENWTSAAGQTPAINTPADGSTINLGNIGVGVTRSVTVTIKGTALRSAVRLAVSGNGWSVTPATLTADAVNHVKGTTATISINATSAGNHSGILTLANDETKCTVNLIANALNGLPAGEPTNISDESFVAHWTYVGNEDSNGCYTLVVKDPDGEDVDTYPRSVKATDEACLVDELLPETRYSYYIECTQAGLRSNVIYVTTAAPIPSVQILYDGDLDLVGVPGTPGEPAELLLDIENITDDITFEVDAPFELSSDRETWSRSIVVDPREDRIYARLNPTTEGTFNSTLRVTAGSYTNDDAELTGHTPSMVNIEETFENPDGVNGTYAKSRWEFTGVAAKWWLTGAGAFKVKNEAHSGDCYIRFDKSGDRTLELADDCTDGIGTVTLWAAAWSEKDGSAKFELEYSTDSGLNWVSAGEGNLDTPTSSTKTYHEFTFTVNRPGKTRFRIRQTYGQRMCIDDITTTSYGAGVEGIFGDERGTGWDARAVGGCLVVDLDEDAFVAVHGVDGITRVATRIAAGSTTFELPAGLYIVVVGRSTRRVLIK